MENCHLSTLNLFFVISNVILGQINCRREQKLGFLINHFSRFGYFKKPFGVYAVKQRVMTLVKKTEAKIVIDDVTIKTRLNA